MTPHNTGAPAGADQSVPAESPVPAGPPRTAPSVSGPASSAEPAPGQAESAPGQAEANTAQAAPHHKVRRTRVGGVWVTLAVSAVILILLLVFILENLKRADVSLFGAHADLPLGVALLLSAVAGAIIVIVPGTGRILQLRRIAHRHRNADAQQADSQPPSH